MVDPVVTGYKCGRRPAVFTLRSVRSAVMMGAALEPLGAPPDASNDYVAAVTVPWQNFANSRLGCCCCEDTAHTLMLRTANVGRIVVPAVADVVGLYSAVGGYVVGDPATDRGCSEDAMCAYLRATGFLGHKADATVSVDPKNLDHVRWVVQLAGHCRLGLNLPGYAVDQFGAGRRWDVQSWGDQSTDGHDVPVVDYRGGLLYVVSWGKIVPMTPAAVLAWAEEAHAELFYDWISAQGLSPSKFDLGALAEKLESL